MAHGAENRRTPEAALHLSTSSFGMTVPVSGIVVRETEREREKKKTSRKEWVGANWLMTVITDIEE